MAEPEIRAFLSHLAVCDRVSSSTQNQALNAVVFLYRGVLQKDLAGLGGIERASHSQRIPVVLSRDEVRRTISCLHGSTQLMAQLLYGCGLRLQECVRLRIKDIDFQRSQIIVRDGKGRKDRVTVLPQSLEEHLRRQPTDHPLSRRSRGRDGEGRYCFSCSLIVAITESMFSITSTLEKRSTVSPRRCK